MIVSAGNFKFIHDEGTGQLSVSVGGVECDAVTRERAVTALVAKCCAMEEFIAYVGCFNGDGSLCLTSYQKMIQDFGAQARELLEGV